jgi:hypothetical protein
MSFMLLKNLSDISIQDVQTLCDDKVLESRFLDFKAKAIGRGDSDKRDFLTDVCAFANAAGGDLLLGVKTKEGAADELCGIEVVNPDEEKQFLVNLVRDGLEPRIISGLDLKWLPTDESRGIMIVRVHRSWLAPHRVTFLNNMKFYVRNPAGNHPMSVDELRQAFNLSATVAERMRAFRNKMVQAIESYRLPFDVFRGPKIAVLIVPLSAMVDPLDLHIQDRNIQTLIYPIPASGWSRQFCLEGVAMLRSDIPAGASALVFRTGVVEFVSPTGPADRPWALIERVVFESWKQFVALAKNYDIGPPIWVFVTLIEVAGLKLSTGPYTSSTTIRENIVPLPEVSVGVDEFEKPPEILFKRVLDVAGNALGLERWPNYDPDGNYKPPP